jgi:hypothetical protein
MAGTDTASTSSNAIIFVFRITSAGAAFLRTTSVAKGAEGGVRRSTSGGTKSRIKGNPECGFERISSSSLHNFWHPGAEGH